MVAVTSELPVISSESDGVDWVGFWEGVTDNEAVSVERVWASEGLVEVVEAVGVEFWLRSGVGAGEEDVLGVGMGRGVGVALAASNLA